MRYLILTRGLPASGKTTFLKENNLADYTLSVETLRLEFEGPLLGLDGRLTTSKDHDENVWDSLKSHLKARMKLGELIFIDYSHIKTEDLLQYDDLVKHFRYKVFCLDFSDVSLEDCKLRNTQRENYKVVLDKQIDEMLQIMQQEQVPKDIEIIKPQNLAKLLEYTIPDYSNYKKIHHFGDIQGCRRPLLKYFEQYPIQDDELYIFVGDYCDRGKENDLALNYFLDNYQRPNFILLEGNHEEHLWDWACGLESRLDEFKYNTKPQLEKANIDREKVKQFIIGLKSLALYTFDDKKVLVTHGGMSIIPSHPILVKNNQFIRGVGSYVDCNVIDEVFYKNTALNEYQIHGHRNTERFPAQVNPRCFNLEGKIEFDGYLRVATLSHEKGFEVVEIHNPR